MVNFDILGSCVTRDAFELTKAKSDYSIINYFARSSLISIYSAPMFIKVDGIELDSNFQKRTVYNDLNKIFNKYIETSTSDYLIIDFIDERYDVASYKDSYITLSDEFRNSNLPGIFEFNKSGDTKNYFELWEQSALSFLHQLKAVRAPSSVILHKAYWMKTYIDNEGNIVEFPDQDKITLNNKRLERFYSFIERNLPGIVKTIQLDGDYHGDINHKWGLSPFHYEERYYEAFIKAVASIVGK
ncbi:DUF6270 domain-containing protein [Halobacillus litoralis]|uniref:DUF6270 domain-containing protein n=1 Tax=Halobacillus litoralis TaxID=45668 RepID=UPI001CFEEEDE|nr:DUF6270 domain-containing protein [Halobacillus litoralis]